MKEQQPEKKEVEERVEVREVVGDADTGVPIEREEEITMEEPEEVQELHVEIPSDLQLSDSEIQKVGKDAANELLDTMSGARAAVRRISTRISRSTRISKISRVTRTSRISRIWRRAS